jgi:hypothetical protein
MGIKSGWRKPIGTGGGLESEMLAPLRLESVAEFIGIRGRPQLGKSRTPCSSAKLRKAFARRRASGSRPAELLHLRHEAIAPLLERRAFAEGSAGARPLFASELMSLLTSRRASPYLSFLPAAIALRLAFDLLQRRGTTPVLGEAFHHADRQASVLDIIGAAERAA